MNDFICLNEVRKFTIKYTEYVAKKPQQLRTN